MPHIVLNDQAEQHITGVAVVPSHTRSEFSQILVFQEFEHIGVFDLTLLYRGVCLNLRNEVFIVQKTRGVVEQMANTYTSAIFGKIHDVSIDHAAV